MHNQYFFRGLPRYCSCNKLEKLSTVDKFSKTMKIIIFFTLINGSQLFLQFPWTGIPDLNSVVMVLNILITRCFLSRFSLWPAIAMS